MKRGADGEPAAAQPSAAEREARATRAALAALPSAEMYETSYMHRDHVTQLITTSTDFIVTASRDGQIKFWKKMQKGIEFIKLFRAHLAPITCVAASHDGTMLATTAPDKAFKIFDVLSFDMINWVKLDFIPGARLALASGLRLRALRRDRLRSSGKAHHVCDL